MKHFSYLLRSSLSAALLILLWLAGPAARAQAPAWQTVVTPTQVNASGNGGNTSAAYATAVDAQGNVYLAGSFNGTVSFGASALTSAGSSDAFVAKWSRTAGNFVWAQRIGGNSYDVATSVAINGSNVYVAGTFASTNASMGGTVVNNAGGSSGTNDVFVAKLTDSGNAGSIVWAQRAGGADNDGFNAMVTAGTGVYMVGSVGAAGADFGSTVWTGTGSSEGFLTKLVDAGSAGSFAIVQRLGGLGRAEAAAMVVSGTNIYLAGKFSNLATFGSTSLTSVGNSDAFVAKANDTGTACIFAWAQRAGGAGPDEATALALTGATLYAAGTIGSNAADFGNTTLSAGGSEAFVTKLTDTGTGSNFGWARQTGGNGFPRATGLVVSASNIYLVGWFSGRTVSFGNITLTNTPQPGSFAYTDGFLTLLTDTGINTAFTWVKQFGGYGTELGIAVAVNGSNVCIAGWLTSPAISFDSHTIANPTFSQIGFFASLTDPTLLATTAAQSNLSFFLYPNPARAATTVALAASPGTASATLTLRDALGRAVRAEVVPLPPAGLRYEFDLTNLPAGLYALQVQADAATATRRLVVE